MLRAADVMSPTILTLEPGTTLAEAAHALRTRGVSGAPVCDAEGRLVGMLSKSDLVEVCFDEHARVRPRCVGEVMSTDVITAGPNEPVRELIQQMLFEGVHRIVVVDKGTVVGIVTPLDVLRAMYELEPARTRDVPDTSGFGP